MRFGDLDSLVKGLVWDALDGVGGGKEVLVFGCWVLGCWGVGVLEEKMKVSGERMEDREVGFGESIGGVGGGRCFG